MAWLRERFLLQIRGREQSVVWEESRAQTDNSRLNIASRLDLAVREAGTE